MSKTKNAATLLVGMVLGASLVGGAAAAGIVAEPTWQNIYVDGQQVSMTAYNIAGNNYVKLRDIGQQVGFNVYWQDGVQIDKAADTVQRIFGLFLSGMTLMPISRILNQEERKTPAQLQMELYGKKKTDVRQFLWSYTSVKNILQDESYVGVLYNHQQEIKDGKRVRYVPQAEWFRHEGMFPPIISRADWDQAQALLQKQSRKREQRNTPCHRYAGLLTCSECGAPFVAINRYWNGNCRVEYICKSYMRYGKNTCSSHRIREEVLDQMVQEKLSEIHESARQELAKLKLEAF